MSGYKAKYRLLIFSLVFPLFSFGQFFYVPQNYQHKLDLEKSIYDSAGLHSALKDKLIHQDFSSQFWNTSYNKKGFLVYPILSLNNYMQENFNYYNQIGISINATFNDKWYIHTNVSTSFFQFDDIRKQQIDSTGFIPHDKKYDGSNDSFYSLYNLDLDLIYKPYKFLTLSIGKNKHFLGDGYQSLFISNNTASFPYGNILIDVWRIKYSVLYCFLQDVEFPDYSTSYNKYNTIHFLSFNISKRFDINLFESVTWSGRDTINHRGFDVNYLNPIIFFRPVEFSLDDPTPDNVLLGAGFKFNFYKNYHFYGQIFIDDFLLSEFKANNGYWANKQGFQLGVKAYDFFGVENLYFLSELNYVRPFTYAHLSSLSSYSHQNEALAHPLGANFVEQVNYLRYRNSKFIVEGKWIYAKYGSDSANVSLGNEVMKPYILRNSDYGHEMFQGVLNQQFIHKYRVSYKMWDKFDMYAFIGVKLSHRFKPSSETKAYFNFGITTFLNFYDPDYY